MVTSPSLGTRVVLTIFLTSLLCVPLSADLGSGGQDGTTWTVMVYMAADTDPSLPWAEDINEMEAATIPDWMKVVALVDPNEIGDSFLLEIREDIGYNEVIVSDRVDDEERVIPAGGEVDMASPQSLRDFIVFAADRYPADRLVLILWGHGGGWHGLCQDRTHIMSLPALADALSSATEQLGRKLDMVVVDACAEGVLETIYEIRDYADFYVGSERNVPAPGLRYDLALDSLARDRDLEAREWGSYICETYRVYLYFEGISATMAVFDLAAVDDLVDRLVEYGLSARGYSDLYADMITGMLIGTASSDFLTWYLDTGDMLRRSMAASLPLETKYLAFEALRAYDALVYDFHSYASPSDPDYPSIVNSTGASIYLPSADPVDEAYWNVSMSDTGWADIWAAIRSKTEAALNGPAPDIVYKDTDGDDAYDQAVIQWAPGLGRYEAWVFVQTPSGMQLISGLESADPNITIEGCSGELLVSASAWEGGDARSHHTLNVLLSTAVSVTAKVIWRGEAITDGLSVYVVTGKGRVELVPEGDSFVGSIMVVQDADYGELVTVEVRTRGGELLAQNRTFVQGSEIDLEISLSGEPAEELGPEFIIPAAVLIVSALAVALYSRNRGTGRSRR